MRVALYNWHFYKWEDEVGDGGENRRKFIDYLRLMVGYGTGV